MWLQFGGGLVCFHLLLPIYLLTYLFISFKNNNLENDFNNLGINLTSQIVNHFINENDKVQIEYPVTLVGINRFV